MITDTVLIIGANGQLGSVLSEELQKIYGKDNVIASDVYLNSTFDGVFEIIDATDIKAIENIVNKYAVNQIYHLAAILSAKGEKNPLRTWDLNMSMMLNVFEVARTSNVKKVFFPSFERLESTISVRVVLPNFLIIFLLHLLLEVRAIEKIPIS